jgi:hypothetical protein
MKFGFAILTYLSVLTNAKTDKVESTLLFCAAVSAMDLSNIKLSIEVQITQKAAALSLAFAVFLYHAQYYRVPTIYLE